MTPVPVHCACVIHGSAYTWDYVDNLYQMLRRHLDPGVILHVLTEPDRSVPAPYVAHPLCHWPGAQGPKAAWWNKLQLFRDGQFHDRVLYFDLDVVIVRDISWMLWLDKTKFWTLRDFRYLWRPSWTGINSSVMVWHPDVIQDLAQELVSIDIDRVMSGYLGDQDYLTARLPRERVAFLDPNRFQSWRWQVFDGGMDMHTRHYRRPGAGVVTGPYTDVVIFHGRPKPHQIDLPWIQYHWRGQGQPS